MLCSGELVPLSGSGGEGLLSPVAQKTMVSGRYRPAVLHSRVSRILGPPWAVLHFGQNSKRPSLQVLESHRHQVLE